MELRHLRYFAAVAETLNFSRAAEKLHIAQPALSRQIRALEQEIGAQLLERNRVRVQLTDAGRAFLAHVQKLLLQVDVAVTAARETAQGRTGELIVCNDWRLSVGAIPRAVNAFRARHPRVEVSLAELEVHEQVPALRSGRAHLGFVPREMIVARDDLETLTVVRSHVVAILPPDHPLANESLVALRTLRDETWLYIDSEAAREYRSFVTQVCRLAGFTPRFNRLGNPLKSLQGVIASVASGFGVAILPHLVVPPGLNDVACVTTDCEPQDLCAVWRRDASSALLDDFVEMLREQVGDDAEL